MRLKPGFLLRSGFRWVAYSAPPDPLAGFKGAFRPSVDNEGGKDREMMRKKGKRKKGEKMEILDFAPLQKILWTPMLDIVSLYKDLSDCIHSVVGVISGIYRYLFC